MLRKVAVLGLLALALISLASCTEGGSTNPYLAQADARATEKAASAQLKATQAALADRAMQATIQAARTKDAADAEIALLEAQAEATRQAFELAAIQAQTTAFAQETQAAGTAYAGQTATAWAVTATPLAATQASIVRAEQDAARRASWRQYTTPIQTILPTVILFTVLILLILGAVLAYRRLMPVLVLRARTIKRGPHDAPIILYDNLVVDPDRNFGPALLIGKEGATSTGQAPNPQLQERVTARDQAVDLIRGMPQDKRERAEAQRIAARLVPQPLPPGDQVKIEVLPADQPPVGGWLQEVEHKLLTDGEEL